MGANLKEVRERISSVNSTQQITKAMKMVSAAKLRRAQDAITQMRPYANKLSQMLSNLMSNIDGSASTTYGQERDIVHAAVVVVTSNRGLCGAFNTNIIKAAEATIENKYAEVKPENLTILCVGKKGYDYFRRRYKNVNPDFVNLFDDLAFENVSEVAEHIMSQFTLLELDNVTCCYGRFKNAGVQFAEAVQYLPVQKVEPVEGSEKKGKADYIFEPSQAVLLEYLIPNILKTQFQKYVLDTHASEHGARMTAMDKATENANDLLKELKINYNKARQEAITNELSEIVGGAAALETS